MRPWETDRAHRSIRERGGLADTGRSIFIMTVELLIEDSQADFGNKPCGSSTNLAAMPLSNSA